VNDQLQRLEKALSQKSTIASNLARNWFVLPVATCRVKRSTSLTMYRSRRSKAHCLNSRYPCQMDVQSAVLSAVVFYRGLCFQWLVLYDALGNIGYQCRIGAGEWASDWIDSGETVSAEAMATFMTIIPDLPIGMGTAAIDAQLLLTSASELLNNPLPEWRQVDWFDPGLPAGIPVEIVRKFIER